MMFYVACSALVATRISGTMRCIVAILAMLALATFASHLQLNLAGGRATAAVCIRNRLIPDH
jgi:hypothetical protein